MSKLKRVLIVSIISLVFTGIAMIITGLSKGFGSKSVLDITIIIFSANIFVVFLCYVLYKKKQREKNGKGGEKDLL